MLFFMIYPCTTALSQDIGSPSDRVTFAFISVERLLRDCKSSPDTESDLVRRARIATQQLAQKFKLDFVIQNAVYASQRIDLTPHLLSTLSCATSGSSPTAKTGTPFPAQNARVGYVDNERILQESPLTRSLWEALPENVRAKGVGYAMANSSLGRDARVPFSKLSAQLRDFAQSAGYDLILQQAAWIDPKSDITTDFLRFSLERK